MRWAWATVMGNGHLKPRDVFGYERWRGSGKVVEEWRLGAVAEAAATTRLQLIN